MLHSDVFIPSDSKESTDFIVLKLSHSNSDFGVKNVRLSNDGKIFVCDCASLESLSRSLTLDPSGLGKNPQTWLRPHLQGNATLQTSEI